MEKETCNLTLFVKPGAKANKITRLDIDNKLVKVHLQAVARKGKANKAILTILSESLDLPTSNISIISGMSSRTKMIQIHIDHQVFFKWLMSLDQEIEQF